MKKHLSLIFTFILTGCLGGVTVQKKTTEAVDPSNQDNYERVVQVDYGTQAPSGYDDELSETLGENAATLEEEILTEESPSSQSTVEEEPSSGTTSSLNEYCGIIYKSFTTNNYYLQTTSRNYKLSLTSNLEYGLEANLHFPMDSANVCIQGEIKTRMTRYSSIYSTIIEVSGFSSSLELSINHPDRKNLKDSFAIENCGEVTLERNPNTLVDIYKLRTHDGQNLDLKFKSGSSDNYIYDREDIADDSSISISNGSYCLYSNSAPAQEEVWTYRRFFRVEGISGPWN